MRIIAKALIGAALLSSLPATAEAATLFQLDIYGPNSSNTSADKPRFILSNLSTAGETITGFSLSYSLLAGMPNAIIDVVDSFTSIGGVSPSIQVLSAVPTNSNGVGQTGLDIIYKDGTFQPTDQSQFRAEFDLNGQNGTNVDFRDLLFSSNATGTVTFGNGQTATFSLGSYGDKPVYTYTGTGAVPEPATWAMMIGGFALAGTMMRRRQSLSLAVA